jgi:hypothetical protein
MSGGSTKQCGALFCLTFCRLLYPIRKDKTAKAKPLELRGSHNKGFIIALKIFAALTKCASPFCSLLISPFYFFLLTFYFLDEGGRSRFRSE